MAESVVTGVPVRLSPSGPPIGNEEGGPCVLGSSAAWNMPAVVASMRVRARAIDTIPDPVDRELYFESGGDTNEHGCAYVRLIESL